MNPKIGAGEAAPKKASDEAVADAMRALEDRIRELDYMADITANTFDRAFNVQTEHDSYLALRVTKHEWEQFGFLVNNVANRATKLRQDFDTAYTGEVVR